MTIHRAASKLTVKAGASGAPTLATLTPSRTPDAIATGVVAAIYVRVSTEEQGEGTSLDTQQAACLKLAAEKGLLVPPQYVFREMASGAAPVRPAIEQIRTLVHDKLVGAVICYSSDRLSRDEMKLMFLADELMNAGAKLYFVTESDFEDTPTGWLLLHVRGFASALERQRIIERTVRGKRAKLQAGKLIRGTDLYGYTFSAGKRKIVAAQAEVVRRIFDLASSGTSIREITDILSADGVPSPKGKPVWGRSTVSRILHEEGYRGFTAAWKWKQDGKGVRRRPEDEWIVLPDGTTPRIVGDGVWYRVQAQLRRNRELAARNLTHPDVYLLRGHVVCGHCGFPMWGERRFQYGHWGTEYRCRGRTGHLGSACRKGEGLPSINGEALDQIVWQEIERVLADPKLLERENQKRANRRLGRAADALQPIERELEAIARGRRRLARAISAGEGDDAVVETLVAELRTLSEREATLKNKLAVAQAGDRVRTKRLAETSAGVTNLATLKKRLASLDFDAKRLALEALAARVEVFRAGSDARAILHITLPVPGTAGVERSIALDTYTTATSSSCELGSSRVASGRGACQKKNTPGAST